MLNMQKLHNGHFWRGMNGWSVLTVSPFVVFKGGIPRRHRKSRTADPKVKKRPKSNGHGDIWEKVGEKWKGQDEVMKVLTKFNVRY